MGCTPDRGAEYGRATTLAEEAHSHGQYKEAATDYAEAARTAKIPRDADHARYLEARMREQGGDLSVARAAYETIASANPPLEDSADAAYRGANLRVQSGDAAAGWLEIRALLSRFPGSGIARPALRELLLHVDADEGDAATLELLRKLSPTLAMTECAEDIAYEIALRMSRLGQTAAARDAFAKVAEQWPYPQGLHFDDALYRASELDEQLGRYDEAVSDLQRMLKVRESSLFVGSYERPRYDAAQLRLADLYHERLHDDARARTTLHDLYANFTTSVLREKALWKEAELWANDGDAKKRCAVLATLVDDFHDSRYVPCAIERCPSIALPRGSHAPKACRQYLEAGGEGSTAESR